MSWNNEYNIVKYNGQCWNKGNHKYCFYWRAKHSKINKKVVGYMCSLFDEDKEGRNSLPQCNKKYGMTFDGRVNGTTSL